MEEPRGREDFADGSARAVNTMAYTSREIERVARAAFDVAMKYHLRLALPGVDPSTVELKLLGNLLTVSAERKASREAKDVESASAVSRPPE